MELTPLLSPRGAFLQAKRKVYDYCVQRVMMYGGETWPMRLEDMHRFEREREWRGRWLDAMSGESQEQNI